MTNPPILFSVCMRFLKHFFASKTKFSAILEPEEALTVIGDIHGRLDLLERLLLILDQEAPDRRLILIGDYIDRGEQSAQVLERIRRLQSEAGYNRVICLIGNHEQMMLDFLDAPEKVGPRWLRYGGLQTMASYGISPPSSTSSDEKKWNAARDALRTAMGHETESWLNALHSQWQSGNVAVVHAAADPELPMDLQEHKTLIWGYESFWQKVRTDGIWVVHGHTIVVSPQQQDGRISVDTGAYATGRLTAALISRDTLRFLST
jgi:serine/threonine protein phosphatase 1